MEKKMTKAPITNGADLNEDFIFEDLFDNSLFTSNDHVAVGFIDETPAVAYAAFNTNALYIEMYYDSEWHIEAIQAIKKRLQSEQVNSVMSIEKGSGIYHNDRIKVEFFYTL